MTQDAFQVGSWRVEPSLLRLSKAHESKTLAPRVMDLLVALAASPGEVVTRDELHARVWNGDAIGEDVLRRAVFELRRALGDSAQAPTYVETVPRRGYRLLTQVTTKPATSSVGASPAPNPRRPVARLAFLALAAAALAAVVAIVFVSRWFSETAVVAAGATAAPSAPSVSVLPAVRPLTSLPGAERMPILSRDGRRVAFISRDPEGRVDVWLQDVDADTPVRLTDDPRADAFPAWSPDDGRIAWARFDEDAWQVVVRALGSGSPQVVMRLDTGEQIAGLSWSPTADVLAIGVVGPSDRSVIEGVDLETGERRPLSDPPPTSYGDTRPVFAPNGREVAFVRTRVEGVQAIYVVSLPDGVSAPEEREVAAFDGKVPGLAWDADGIVLNRYLPDNRRAFWRLDPETGVLEQLAIPASFAFQVTASAGRLVFVDGDHGGEIAILDLRAGGVSTPAPSTFWDSSPAASPDGKRIAFASMRSGSPEIWTAGTDGGAPVRHTHVGGAFTSHPQWSPDGRRLAFDSRGQAGADVYVLDVDSAGPPRSVTDGAGDNLVPSWSRDGQHLYFASNRSGAWQIWRQPHDGGAAIQITRNGGFFGMEDPVTGDLIFTKRERSTSGLWRLVNPATTFAASADASKNPEPWVEVPWTEAPVPFMWGTWVLTEDQLVAVVLDKGLRVSVLDRRSGRIETLARLEGGIAGPRVDLIGDDRLLYAQPGEPSADLMVVE